MRKEANAGLILLILLRFSPNCSALPNYYPIVIIVDNRKLQAWRICPLLSTESGAD